LGWDGQANYAAGNNYLDALASLRHAEGRPALSIAWGPFSETGMAASRDYLNRFAAQGLMSITPRYGMAALTRVFDAPLDRITIAPIDWQRRIQSGHASADDPFLADIVRALGETASAPAHAGAVLDTLAVLPSEDRPQALRDYLSAQVSRVLGVSVRKISPDQGLLTLGLDSLMAVELRHRINADLSVDVELPDILGGATIGELATSVLAGLWLDADSPEVGAYGTTGVVDVATLSDDEVTAALAGLMGHEDLGA